MSEISNQYVITSTSRPLTPDAISLEVTICLSRESNVWLPQGKTEKAVLNERIGPYDVIVNRYGELSISSPEPAKVLNDEMKKEVEAHCKERAKIAFPVRSKY